MARYPAGARGRRARNRMYTILALVAIGAVFVYLYGFSHNETEPVNDGPPLNANPDFDVPIDRETIHLCHGGAEPCAVCSAHSPHPAFS